MRILPIAERELRVAARRAGTYWLRFLVPLALIVIATWVFLTMGQQSQRETGAVIFYLLTGGLTLYALVSGLRSTADCLSEEKREGTLGLLFLTDLRGYDVVIGKLLANSVAIFYAVLAVLPVLGIPLLMGGVAGAEFGRLALVLVNTLFFSLSAGMLASALCKNGRLAIATALGFILLLAVVPPLLGLLELKLRDWQGMYRYGFLVPCPVFTYIAGVDKNYNSAMGNLFLPSLVTVHVCGWLFLTLASVIVRHKWQDAPATSRGARWSGWWRRVLDGDDKSRVEFRRTCLDRNAFYWLATRPARTWWTWLPLVLAASAWGWGIYKWRGEWLNPGMYGFTAFALGLIYKVMIGAEAGRRLLEDRKIGAMELLLSTPLSVREILHGQALSMMRQYAGPIAVMLLADGVMFVAGLRGDQFDASEKKYWFWMSLAAAAIFIADIAALHWMGMWQGVASRNLRHAFGGAIAPILALPWVVTALVLTFMSILPYQSRSGVNFATLTLCLWFGVSMMVDLFCVLYARQKLLLEFRHVATQRFQRKASWWQRLTGKA